MKIRTKLILYYGLIILFFLLAAALSISAVSGWSRAADRLAATHSKSAVAERLRSNIFLQINYALDYLYGEPSARGKFESTHESTLSLLKNLKTESLDEREQYFIEDFESTQIELAWIMNRFFSRGGDGVTAENLPDARERLRDIAGEVADDVASLSQYYSNQENTWLKAATKAGSLAMGVIITASAGAIVLFVMLTLLLQRWLVKPIFTVNSAARSISGGNLDIQISMRGEDEWSELAGAVNDMAHSLKTTLQKLSEHERLAAMGEISAYTAHNIRNPLSGIRAAVQVLLGEADRLPHATVDSLKEIIETVDRLDGWLKRLLEFAKPLDFRPEKQDINKLLTEAVSIAHRPFSGSPVNTNWRLAKDIPNVTVDGILLEQAVAAIATNAFQAVGDGGAISFETGFENSDDGSRVMIRISDNGSGIPDHIRPRLFKIFESSKVMGTGLGLAQAKRIIDVHGGTINLRSGPGEGTTVEITLPLEPVGLKQEDLRE